jgi:PAS domain-containing protein
MPRNVAQGQNLNPVRSDDTLIASLSQSDQLRVILETSPAAMVVIDDAGIIRGFGRAAQKLFGYSEEDAIGQNVAILMAPPGLSVISCVGGHNG